MAEEPMRSRYFVDERHALYAGWIFGIAMKHGVPVELVDDEDGIHTNQLRLGVGYTNVMVTVIVPYPPDDWEFPFE
jgi:hypothetical protein